MDAGMNTTHRVKILSSSSSSFMFNICGPGRLPKLNFLRSKKENSLLRAVVRLPWGNIERNIVTFGQGVSGNNQPSVNDSWWKLFSSRQRHNLYLCFEKVPVSPLPTNRKYIGSGKNTGYHWSNRKTVNYMKSMLRTLVSAVEELI